MQLTTTACHPSFQRLGIDHDDNRAARIDTDAACGPRRHFSSDMACVKDHSGSAIPTGLRSRVQLLTTPLHGANLVNLDVQRPPRAHGCHLRPPEHLAATTTSSCPRLGAIKNSINWKPQALGTADEQVHATQIPRTRRARYTIAAGYVPEASAECWILRPMHEPEVRLLLAIFAAVRSRPVRTSTDGRRRTCCLALGQP